MSTPIRLRFIHTFTDRHGTVRRYFRRPGFARVPLPGPPGSPEFMLAYNAALNGQPGEKLGISLKPGTVSALMRAYFHSSHFKHLSPEFQRVRANILHRFEQQHGDKRVVLLKRHHVQQMVEAKRETPFAARNFLHSLRAVMQFAEAAGFITDNPTTHVKTIKAKTGGFRDWTDQQIATFEAAHQKGTRARLALALLLYTAQRRSDVVRMGRQHLQNEALRVMQQKTGRLLSIPVHPELKDVIDRTPADQLTFLVTKDGKPFSPAGFTNWIRKCCNEAGLPKGLSAHGLRKSACRRLAEAGCSTHEIAAISGHLSLREVERYTRAVDQARMAQSAMDALTTKQQQKNG